MSYKDQVAIVTGASSGIGWELAKQLSSAGAKVGLIARRKERLEALAAEIKQQGGIAAVAAADVGDRQQTLAAFAELRQVLGPVDLMVANAGLGLMTLLPPTNVDDVEAMVRVNLLGVIYSLEAVLPEMLERNSGHLAAVSSLASYKGLPGESGYCATKAAVNTYMEGLRIQLRGTGIATTTICPGFVRTPMTDVNDFGMPWLMEADEAARRIMRALKARRKHFSFPWQMTLLMRLTRNWAPEWLIGRVMRDYNKQPHVPSHAKSKES
jgi:short-subunit dehydrogenase